MKNNRVFATSGRLGAFTALATLLVLAGCASNTPAPLVERSPSAAQATAVAKDTYVVKPGDTVYSIARDHKMDFRELIALNGIDSPNRIAPGKVLKIKPTAEADSGVVSTAPVLTDEVVARPIGDEPVAEIRAPSTSNTGTLKREPKAGKEVYSDHALALAQNPVSAQAPESVAPAGAEAKPETKPAEAAVGGDELAWIWPANGKIVGTFSEGGIKGVDIAGKAGDPVIAAGDGKIVYSGTGLRGYGKLVIIKHNNTYLSAYAHNQAILVKEGQTVSKGQKIAEMGDSDAQQVMLHFEVRRQGKPVDPLKYLPQR